MSEARTLPVSPGPRRMVSGLGVASLVLGLLGLVVALMPCVGMIGLPLSLLGLILGVVGLLVAVTDRRTELGFPMAGTVISLAAGLLPFVWIYVFVNALEASARKAQETAPPMRAGELLHAYDENEAKANTEYKDKWLKIQGKIDAIDPDYVTLTNIDQKGGLGSVQVFPFDKDKPKLKNLHKGQELTVVGRCEGKRHINVVIQPALLE